MANSSKPVSVRRNSTEDLMQLEPSTVFARLQRGEITRRDVFKTMSALGLASFGLRMMDQGALAADELKMIIWEGYADDLYRKPFEEANNATVSFTEAGTGDEMFAQMETSGGKNYDMVSASSDLPRRLYDANLLAEIDTTKLTNYNDLWEQFKRPDYITFDEKLYGVNFAWGPTLLITNSAEVPTAPTSWKGLLDEQYKGKISTWNYPLQIAQYALLLDPVPADPYDLTDEQLAQVKDILVQQRPLVRLYWNTGLELSQAFLNKEVVISDGWSWITSQITADGGTPVETIPTEGVTGWSDSWVISKAAKNYDLAMKWAGEAARELAGVAEKVNVDLCVENVWNGLMYSPLELAQFIDDIGSKRVGVYFDVGNMMGLHQHPPDWIKILGRR
ncbi:MAG TPA: extracellular solute-binding protein, partial [Thermomicrobiales bacterium]|nr:extracellular solute-binding protein [Thermomicrobiales bacterium]